MTFALIIRVATRLCANSATKRWFPGFRMEKSVSAINRRRVPSHPAQ